MIKLPLVIFVVAMPFALLADEATVRVEPSNLQRSRPLQKQTETAAIRDYLQSWQSLRAALEQNRPDLLDQSFVGTALDKLTDTMHQQEAAGIQVRYLDRAHELKIISYSPEGLSIQLTDNVEYDQQVIDHDKVLTNRRVRARYVVVMTPAEVRWRVRVFQADTE
jgi:predicted PhzF superfamily epimerase YddE/YHI9